jgi:HD-like signal output (HDOD) protein
MIQGEIQTFPLPDLIQWLALTRRTGELTMAQGTHRLKFYFGQGKFAASSSSDLAESNSATQVRTALAAALAWGWGHFVFRDAPLPAEIAAANLQLGTETLLLEAASHVIQNRRTHIEPGARDWAQANGHSQTFTLADDLRLQIVDRLLREDFRVPPMPQLAVRVLELTRNENFSLRNLGNLILTDQAIAAQILRLANSALRGARREVDTLPVAVQRLGSDEVVNIVLTASLQARRSKQDIFAAHKRQLWMRSAAAAFFARAIAAKANLDHNLAFLCGLLMDFGMNVLYTLTQEMLARRGVNGNLPTQVIAEVVQDYHSRIGRVVGEKWRLPEAVTSAMAYHHCIESAGTDRAYVATAALADYLASFALSHPRAQLEEELATLLPEQLAAHPAALLIPLDARNAGAVLADLPRLLDQALELVLD